MNYGVEENPLKLFDIRQGLEYLNNLRCDNGDYIIYNRLGSTNPNGVLMDIYEIYTASHKLDKIPSGHSGPSKDKSNFSDMFPIPTGTPSDGSNIIKWQTFLKDLITWIIIMFFLYLFWKKVLHPNKISKFGSKILPI